MVLIVDATDRIMGRLSAIVAKKLLEGETVTVVNAGQCVISGNAEFIKRKYLAKKHRGSRQKGPFIHRGPDALFRRCVRGMVPRKKYKGREAYGRLKVFSKCPEDFKDLKKFGKCATDLQCKFLRLKEVSKFLGSKVE